MENVFMPMPLADPLRILSRVVLVGVILQFIVAIGFAIPLGLMWLRDSAGVDQQLEHELVAEIGSLMGSVFIGSAIYLLIRPRRAVNAYYLRAFCTDDRSGRLRRMVSAAIGPEFRMSGIRPIAKRSSIFTRFLLPGWTALRYSESRFMDLEAGKDWLARLSTSFQEARIAIIDLREMTQSLRDEIHLAWRQLGPRRCAFIVDGSIPIHEWHDRIRVCLNVTAMETQQGQVAVFDHSAPDEFCARVREIISAVPSGAAGMNKLALEFIASKVAHERWAKGWTTNQITQAIAGVFIGIVGFTVLGLHEPRDPLWAGSCVAIAIGVAHWVLFLVVVGSAIGQSVVSWKWRARGRAIACGRPLAILGLVMIGLTTKLAGHVPTLMQHIDKAELVTARTAARSIYGTVCMYRIESGRLPSVDEGLDVVAKKFFEGGSVGPDPWGNAYSYRLLPDATHFQVRSRGPDRQEDTDDDIVEPERDRRFD